MAVDFILTLTCPDRLGIVAAVSRFLADRKLLIVESHQHQDESSQSFFMRAALRRGEGCEIDLEDLQEQFAPIVSEFDMQASIHEGTAKPRVLLMVSKFGHCLYDLLHRWRAGHLPVEIVAVASNHDDMRSFVEWNGLPYHHLPMTKETKAEQEKALIALVDLLEVDLVVLARYMQILSDDLCKVLSGRCINIHHSFLPSFKGAKPYHQAHARGVKIIGATAHYVTCDLDEGPIIEQDVRRVTHARTADELVEIGQDVECVVLARAVRWHAEHRILLNGHQTVVFE